MLKKAILSHYDYEKVSMDKLTIGQMAKMNSVTRQTLRLYDEIGLLKPSVVGDENNYRYYRISQCARLDMIQYMKSLGMSLKTIKEQLDKKDISLLKSILEQKKASVDKQILDLKYQKRAIDRTISAFELYEASPPDGAIVLEYMGKRLMHVLDSGINFYDHGLDVYEEILRDLKRDLIAKGLPQIYFSNAGTILRRENFEKREFAATEFFVFVDKDYVAEELTCTLSGGMYLCIFCNRFEKEREYTIRLLNAVVEQGYTVAGDCICEVIIDSPVFEENRGGMCFRIQVPVRFL
jgi:DNA-binding transcriptional MerR regulator